MKKLMLIDAVHPEETRVALVNEQRVDDFDFEAAGNEQLRGNIYLAKVTRVEPSLQACFVEYGGNRHGFLAFSEIHPDYYQLPQEDREALLAEAAREAAEADESELDDGEDDDFDDHDDEDDHDETVIEASDDQDADVANGEEDADATEAADDADLAASDESEAEDDTGEEDTATADAEDVGEKKPKAKPAARKRGPRKTRATSASRRYKIQEVIRRRQVLLVQVVKEERGNKGAALTTYLSLAGRYSVLMPNTPRGGGISRKIPSGSDRKRLKQIMDGLDVPKGMGLIVRTAGAKRTKSDIQRDYEYLQKLWDKIRSKTLDSMAPTLIHEEGGLVHRAMRDMFDRQIEEVVIQGDEAYREAKDLAKTLMPTQARKVKRWTAPNPLFVSEGIEDQLDSVFNPTVQMKSGGYLVINQTEALVAIDVNSGKSTRERSIEQTALRTNLEAAEEACRQMRLRDLAGLVVIDFIDMEENKNNRAVEKKMKECLKLDRARVQNSRISQFGLMEISRQRRRAGVLQSTSEKCTACDGTGRRRSISSAALQLLRAIEARAAGGGLRGLTVTAPTDVALYLLNTKRDAIAAIEEEAGFAIAIKSSGEMIPGDFNLDAQKASNTRRRRKKFVRDDYLEGDEDDHLLPEPEDGEPDTGDDGETSEAGDGDDGAEEDGSRRKRRRRGRRGGRRRKRDGDAMDPGAPPSDGGALLDGIAVSVANLLDDEPPELPSAEEGGLTATPVATVAAKPAAPTQTDTPEASAEGEDKPRKRRRRRRRKRGGADAEGETTEAVATEAEPDEPEAAPSEPVAEPIVAVEPEVADTADTVADAPVEVETPEPAQEPEPEPEPAAAEVVTTDTPIATEPVLEAGEKPKKKKRGWWSRG
ncbi:MAG: Rne/Rng family ribonuclease [Henriciella sp.]|nr:Rne/Rng family ribonuclease [Henriciella sp.]